MANKSKFVHLDFHEHDTAAALTHLAELVEKGEISGMVYACIGKRGSKPIFGATGRLASDDIMAAGLSAILEDQFTQPFLMCSTKD